MSFENPSSSFIPTTAKVEGLILGSNHEAVNYEQANEGMQTLSEVLLDNSAELLGYNPQQYQEITNQLALRYMKPALLEAPTNTARLAIASGALAITQSLPALIADHTRSRTFTRPPYAGKLAGDFIDHYSSDRQSGLTDLISWQAHAIRALATLGTDSSPSGPSFVDTHFNHLISLGRQALGSSFDSSLERSRFSGLFSACATVHELYSEGFSVSFPPISWDANYATDLLATRGNTLNLVQVKGKRSQAATETDLPSCTIYTCGPEGTLPETEQDDDALSKMYMLSDTIKKVNPNLDISPLWAIVRDAPQTLSGWKEYFHA
jgi:hypothetical protein